MRAWGVATRLLKGVEAFLRGERHYCFYFTTITLGDAIRAFGYALASTFRIPVAGGARDALAGAVRERYGGEVFFYGSARSALCDHLCALELPQGAEIVVTGFTCEVVANAVLQAGLRPVYADIDPITYGADPTSVRRVLSDRTAVIIVQHSFGNPAALPELLTIARDHGLYVIEDCAVALGSAHDGQPLGTFGDAAIVSFELSKTITSCRGGMLVVHGATEIVERQRTRYGAVPEPRAGQAAAGLFQLSLSGVLYRPRIYPLGRPVADILFRLGLFRPSTLPIELRAGRPESWMVRLSPGQAAILLRQWRRLPAIMERARTIAARYEDGLATCSDVEIAAVGPEACLIRYPLRTRNRDRLHRLFEEEGIELGSWFTAPLSSPAVDQAVFGYREGQCPEAERTAATICNLPTHVRITDEVVEKVMGLVRVAHADEGDGAE